MFDVLLIMAPSRLAVGASNEQGAVHRSGKLVACKQHNPVSQNVLPSVFWLRTAEFFLRYFNSLPGSFVVPSRRGHQLNKLWPHHQA
jgi:hypothetical protein